MGTIYKSGIPYSGGGGGSSLPDGGTTGQALVKKSDTNQDVEWKNIGSGGGAEFSIDSASNSGVVGQGNDYFGVNLNEEDTIDLSLIQPNVYGKTKTVPTKEYVDSKATVIVGSDWGVAKVGAANIPISYDEIAEVTVDISDMGFKSSDDFKIAITGMSNYIFCVPSISTTSFKIRRVGASISSNTWVHYIIFAKGYGSTPKGGTIGQVLTKKSNVNGDVDWADAPTGGGESYSTDEQAVGTWVDGKTIYQKTMTCAMPTDIVDGTIKNTFVPHGVSNIAQIVGCESVGKATSGNVGGEDGNMSVGNMFTHISADSYQINLSANIAEYSGKEYFVTFRYTKTT